MGLSRPTTIATSGLSRIEWADGQMPVLRSIRERFASLEPGQNVMRETGKLLSELTGTVAVGILERLPDPKGAILGANSRPLGLRCSARVHRGKRVFRARLHALIRGNNTNGSRV